MDSLIILIIARAIERAIIVSSGLASLWFGYRLFFLLAEQRGSKRPNGEHGSDTEFGGAGFNFKAQRIAPGVFFAIFGSLILGTSLIYGPKLDSHINASNAQLSGLSYRGSGPSLGATAAETARQRVLAFNTLENAAGANSDEAIRRVVTRSSDVLQPIKRDLVDRVLGGNRYAEWLLLSELRSTQPDQFTSRMSDQEVRRKFFQVEELLGEVISP